jgi:hypothetical protein
MGDKAGPISHERKRKQGEKSLSPKQIRARARRNGGLDNVTMKEREALAGKPMEEWDLEELARGRPRDKNGNFSGRPPTWITREMHEKSIELFKDMVRTDMRSHTKLAMDTLKDILEDNDIDEKGKPTTPASVKVDVAKFLIEHLVGKPTQPVQADINVKLQGILGAVLVQPDQLTGGYMPSSSHREVEGSIVEDDEDEDGGQDG